MLKGGEPSERVEETGRCGGIGEIELGEMEAAIKSDRD